MHIKLRNPPDGKYEYDEDEWVEAKSSRLSLGLFLLESEPSGGVGGERLLGFEETAYVIPISALRWTGHVLVCADHSGRQLCVQPCRPVGMEVGNRYGDYSKRGLRLWILSGQESALALCPWTGKLR